MSFPFSDHDQSSQTNRTKIEPLDTVLLKSAEKTLQSLNGAVELDVQLFLTNLVGIICDLWESAVDASERHQDILASIENAVRVARRSHRLCEEHGVDQDRR